MKLLCRAEKQSCAATFQMYGCLQIRVMKNEGKLNRLCNFHFSALYCSELSRGLNAEIVFIATVNYFNFFKKGYFMKISSALYKLDNSSGRFFYL